jgi:hypothetical protein
MSVVSDVALTTKPLKAVSMDVVGIGSMAAAITSKKQMAVTVTPLDPVCEDDDSELADMSSAMDNFPVACCPSEQEEDQEHKERLDAIMALETSIVYTVTVVLQTIAIHYVFGSIHGLQYRMMVQDDVLRILGSMWVDITALYFMVLGYLLHERVAVDVQSDTPLLGDEIQYRRHIDVIRYVVPDIVLSCVPYMIMQPFSRYGTVWTTVYTVLGPTLLSTFFDVRVDNEFRMLNESMWMAQLTTLYTLFAYGIYRNVKRVCDSLDDDPTNYRWRLLLYNCVGAWLLGFLHLYAAFEHPVVANAVTRSVITNAVFVFTGMFVAMLPTQRSLLSRLSGVLCSLRGVYLYDSGWIMWGIAVCMLAFYLHHAQNTVEEAGCVGVFGGTPCLWYIDICNVRMYPIYTFFFVWFTDKGILFGNYLFGPIRSPLVGTFSHLSKWVVQWREYNISFMLYSEFIAMTVAYLLSGICPVLTVEYATITILAEICVVTLGCVAMKLYITPLSVRVFDAAMEYTSAGGLLTRMVRLLPV